MAVFYEEGPYLAEVLEHGFELSRSGKPMIVIQVAPTGRIEGAGADEEIDAVSHQYPRTIRLVVDGKHPKMVEFALKKLRYAGFAGERLEELDLVGQEVRCECKHDVYEGSPCEQWDLALPPLERKGVKNDPGLAKKLNALFGKKLKETVPAIRLAPATAPPESDIPF